MELGRPDPRQSTTGLGSRLCISVSVLNLHRRDSMIRIFRSSVQRSSRMIFDQVVAAFCHGVR